MNRPRHIALALLILLAGASSCSREPVSPAPPSQPDLIRTTAPVEAGALGSDPDNAGWGVIRFGYAQSTVTIHADRGGTVTAGRYTLLVPPGALRADTEITLKSLDASGVVLCEALPHGLVFAKPVRLLMDLHGSSAGAQDLLTVFWFNDLAGCWQDVGGTYDPARMTLSTDLLHFSEYAAGRSGW